MSFIEEISTSLSCFCNDFSYLIFENVGGYFEGVKSIASFSDEKIELFLKRGSLIIEGEKLSIRKYYLSDVSISGIITKVERCR